MMDICNIHVLVKYYAGILFVKANIQFPNYCSIRPAFNEMICLGELCIVWQTALLYSLMLLIK